MSATDSCPVCMETLHTQNDGVLKCKNGHGTCLSCAGKMIRPCGDQCKSGSCTGLWFTCPICRTRATVRPPYILAILQGSWEKSHNLHQSAELRSEWLEKCSRVAHVGPATDQPS